jgi:hypothetical protein
MLARDVTGIRKDPISNQLNPSTTPSSLESKHCLTPAQNEEGTFERDLCADNRHVHTDPVIGVIDLVRAPLHLICLDRSHRINDKKVGKQRVKL